MSNGATVVLKPTTLKENQILFRATAPGGTSLASDADFMSARVADSIVAAGGVGRFSAVTLDKILAGKAAAVAPFIGEIEQGMRGGSTPQDLETMFQLLYLRFTQPRADPVGSRRWRRRPRPCSRTRTASPDVVFDQVIDATLSRNHARRQSETPATVDQWNLDTALAFYKARFADAGNFTFVFVGSFTPEAIKPLVETYIASLPATRARETWRDLGISPPTGVVEKTIRKGIAPKSSVAIVMSGPFDTTMRTGWRCEPPRSCCSRGCSTPSGRSSGARTASPPRRTPRSFPRPEFQLRIDWTCDPARTATLGQRVLQEIGFVRTTPLSSNQMAPDPREPPARLRAKQPGQRLFPQPDARRYADGDAANVAAVENVPEQIAALTGAAVQQAAQTYLNTDRYVKVTLVPEGNQ